MKYVKKFNTQDDYYVDKTTSNVDTLRGYNNNNSVVIDKETVVSVPNDEIWYTTSAYGALQPDSAAAFGANIIGNTYYDGKGILKFDGNVTAIGNSAFANKEVLTSINIPNTVTSIGQLAFFNCPQLTAIAIPDSVTSIGNSAFANTGIKYIKLPSGLAGVTINAKTQIFPNCDLVSISVSPNNVNYDSRDNCNAIIRTSDNTLIMGCSNTVIPDTVAAITIGAFYHCSRLTSISIPDSVTSIVGNAFVGCENLESIWVSPNNSTYDNRNYCNAIIETATNTLIRGCNNTTIPDNITAIGVSAFSYCSGLTSITIPEGVISIGQSAFLNCSGLTSITCKAIEPPTLERTTLTSVPSDCAIYVPAASVDAYKAASKWSARAEYIQAIPA